MIQKKLILNMRPYNILKIFSRQEHEVALSQPQDKILLATNNMVQGLSLAWDMGFKFIFLETDTTTILNWLTNDSVLPPDVVPLISNCWNLMARA